MDPLAYYPDQTLDDYLAAQKAAFVPQHMAATAEQISGDENRIEVTPAQEAYDTTYNPNRDSANWFTAQNKTLAVPKGWSSGSLGTNREFNETANAYTESEQWVPGTDPGTGKNMAYRLKSQDKYGNQVYDIQEYGPNGLVGESSTVKYGLYDQNPVLDLIIQAGMAGVLGPLAGTLGASVSTGLGLGLGKVGATALGTALVNAGKTAAMGGDFGDVAKAGLTSGATSYLGSLVGDYLPKDLAPTGIKSLDTALTKGMQSAAGSGVTSLLTGNKNILQDALTAGLGAAAGSGVNSVINDAAGSTGLPPAALNILGPAVIAELMGKDPTGAALKAAIGEITGAIKGSVAGQKDASVAAPKDLMGGITDSGEYLQEDGSVLSVTKSATTGKLSGRLYPRDEVAQDQYQQEIAPFLNQSLPSIRPEDKSYIEDNLAKGVSADSLIAALVAGGRSPEEAQNIFIDATGNLPNQTKTTENLPSDFGLDFGAFAERTETSADTTPKVEVTGQTPDTELMRFLEANGLTSDEAQKILKGTPTPKVVVQGQTPPKDTAVDDLMALLNQYDPKLDNTQQVQVTGTTPKDNYPADEQTEVLLKDAGLDLGAINEGPVVGNDQQVVIRDKLKDDMGLDLNPYYPADEQTEIAPDKLTNDLLQQIEITGQTPNTPLDYSSLETVPDKLTDDITQLVEIIGKTPPNIPLDYSSLETVPEEFPFIYPGEETPPEVNEPVVEPIKPVVKPVVKPVIPKVPVVTPTKTTTTPSYTIPGTTTQLHQELMQLPETDILRMLNPALYAYKDAQKRKKPSGDDQMMALLNELGYRS